MLPLGRHDGALLLVLTQDVDGLCLWLSDENTGTMLSDWLARSVAIDDKCWCSVL